MARPLHIAEEILPCIIELTVDLQNFGSKAILKCSFKKGIDSSCKFFIEERIPSRKNIQYSAYYNCLENYI